MKPKAEEAVELFFHLTLQVKSENNTKGYIWKKIVS